MSLISDSLCTQPLIQLYPVTLSSWWYMEDNLTPWQVACEPQTTFYLLSIMVVFCLCRVINRGGGLNRHHYNHHFLHQCHESIKWDIWIKAAAADVYPPCLYKSSSVYWLMHFSVIAHLLQQFSTGVSGRQGSYLFAKGNSPLLHTGYTKIDQWQIIESVRTIATML